MELNFDPGFRVIGEWRIFEPNRLDFESKFKIDSQYRVNMTQIFSNYSESWVEFEFHQWLNFLGQNDSIFSFSDQMDTKMKPVERIHFEMQKKPNYIKMFRYPVRVPELKFCISFTC